MAIKRHGRVQKKEVTPFSERTTSTQPYTDAEPVPTSEERAAIRQPQVVSPDEPKAEKKGNSKKTKKSVK